MYHISTAFKLMNFRVATLNPMMTKWNCWKGDGNLKETIRWHTMVDWAFVWDDRWPPEHIYFFLHKSVFQWQTNQIQVPLNIRRQVVDSKMVCVSIYKPWNRYWILLILQDEPWTPLVAFLYFQFLDALGLPVGDFYLIWSGSTR
jgi:hypothetical protein